MIANSNNTRRPSRFKRSVLLVLCCAATAAFLGTIALVVAGLRDDIGKADVALVLGSKVESDGKLSPRLRARLDKTLELYNAGYFPEIIASGGIGREGFDEAVVMRDYLVSHGIPQDRVILDSEGTTTWMSARNTRNIARDRKFSSIFVISQYFHIPRARLALKRFGIPTVYSAHPQFFEMRDIYSSFRELFGYLNYFVRLKSSGD